MKESLEVRQALEAIVRCNATDEAYKVIEAAGYRELFPGVIYKVSGEKSRMSDLDVKTARAIITQARKEEIYGGEMPEDDATAIKEADELVDMAEQAWAQYIRGPEVEVILKLANSDLVSKGSENGKSESDSEPEEEAKSEPDNSGDDEKSGPEQDLSGVDESLKKVQPWEGYDEDTVGAITEGINIAATEEPSELKSLLAHIWAYEASHKNRVRVLKHVNTTFTENNLGGGSEDNSEKEDPGQSEDSSDDGGSPDAEKAAEDTELLSQDEGSTPEAEGSGSEVDAKSDSKSETSEPTGKSGKPSGEAAKESKGSGSGDDGNKAYRALIQGVERALHNERVHVPKPPSEEVPDLPWRWSEVPDSDLHDFHMQYGAAAYYKSYALAREERIAMHCREAADELAQELLKKADRYDEKGKEIRVTIIEAHIASDPNVKSWRRRQHKHEQMASAAKREMEGYQKVVENLSRLETMRHQSYERGRK